MKLVADDKIPYIQDFFSDCDELILLPGEKITRAHLQDADLLLTRTVTIVNDQILNNTSVKWIGTATTGTDHIDTAWLSNHGITLATAAGANAKAVAEYVLCCVAAVKNNAITQKTVGIIGCGRIGRLVAELLQSIGYSILCYDPLLASRPPFDFVDELKTLCAQSDIITLHTPLTKTGLFPTHHMVSDELLQAMRPGTTLINAARGSVIDQQALLRADHLQLCFDVWENEPRISLELLNKVFIGTPHIAGYSRQAKYRATEMMYESAAEFFGWKQHHPNLHALKIQISKSDFMQCLSHYNPLAHTEEFRAAFLNQIDIKKIFVRERKNYGLREEFL